jgi:hypothetical protein
MEVPTEGIGTMSDTRVVGQLSPTLIGLPISVRFTAPRWATKWSDQLILEFAGLARSQGRGKRVSARLHQGREARPGQGKGAEECQMQAIAEPQPVTGSPSM